MPVGLVSFDPVQIRSGGTTSGAPPSEVCLWMSAWFGPFRQGPPWEEGAIPTPEDIVFAIPAVPP